MDYREEQKKWISSNPLRIWRRKNDYTLNEVSSCLGVSLMTVQMWESGGFKPDSDNMSKIDILMGAGGDIENKWNKWIEERPKMHNAK